MIPTWFFLVCLAALWWSRGTLRIVPVFIVSTVFGATAAAEVLLLGRAPLTPAIVLLPVLVWIAVKLCGEKEVTGGLSLYRPGGWLALFVLWAVLSAFVMPRIFMGDVLVYTTNRTDELATGVALQPLGPVSTNITQSVYLICGLLAFLGMRALVRIPGASDWFFKGLVSVGVVNAVAGIVNMIEGYGRINLGLGLLRNANYAILEGQTAGALIRIIGTFSETSTFAAFSLPLFAAYLTLWVRGYRVAWTATLCVTTLALLALTTSTTAYVALAIVCVLILILAIGHFAISEDRVRFGGVASVCLLALAVLCVIALLKPEWLGTTWGFIEAMVFQKLESESGIERMQWSNQTWDTFIATYGLGAGAGSARGSGWLIVLAGNTGAVGVLTFSIFFTLLAASAAPPTQDEDRKALHLAAKAGVLGGLVAAAVSAGVIDLGVQFYMFAGVVAGLSHQSAPRSDPAMKTSATILREKQRMRA